MPAAEAKAAPAGKLPDAARAAAGAFLPPLQELGAMLDLPGNATRRAAAVLITLQGLDRGNWIDLSQGQKVADRRELARTVRPAGWPNAAQRVGAGRPQGSVAMSEWPPARIDRLRRLWAQGLSTATIGRLLECSKNGVVGKAHRLQLPPRPSPIRRLAEGETRKPAHPKRVAPGVATVAPLASVAIPPPVVPVAVPVVPMVEVVSAPVPRLPRQIQVRCCEWPMWGDGKPTHVYCDKPRADRSLWCKAHRKAGTITLRPRQAAE